MKNILLPTDFSENSWNAIRYAIRLFEDDDCIFHLFNAYTPVVYDLTYVLISPAQFGIGDPVKFASEENLKELKSQILGEFGTNPRHKFETIARFETLIAGIKELIDERQIDIVLMGTKGATGAKEILFGSNTVQTFSQVKCPIMAIPSNYEFVNPKNILFPTDLEVEYTTSQFRTLKRIAVLHNAKMNAMHVSTGYELTDAQKDNKVMLQTLFNRVSYEFHDFENMGIGNAISKFLEMHEVHLLAMINNKRSFFENVFFKNTINQIGFHLNIPFLVIPSQLL